MGLAASQARYLFLTARKNDIEYNQMQIANDKITLTRQSQAIAEDYSKALNATKLVMATTSGSSADLSYSLLMDYTNSAASISGQYMFATNSGAIALSDSDYATISSLSGSNGASFSLTDAMKQSYLKTKMGISDTDATTYVSGYNTSISSGTTTDNASTTTTCSSISDFLELLKNENIKTSYEDCINVTDPDNTDFNWANAYNSDEVIQLSNNRGNVCHGNMDEACNNLEEIIKNLESALSSFGLNSTALSTAESQTYKRFTALQSKFEYNEYPGNADCPVYEAEGDATTRSETENKAQKFNSIVAVNNTNAKGHTFYGVSVKNLVDSFFTYYQQALGNTVDSNSRKYDVAKIRTNSNFATTVPTKTNTNTNINSTTNTQSKANFYLNQLAIIAEQGYTDVSAITSKDNLQTLVKNGGLSLIKFSSGTTWGVVTSSDTGSALSSQDDESGQDKAEADYKAKTAKINTLEAQLDLKEKNLETELTSINTEWDSVKTLISKNVERSFKMFQA